jgi:hypothetical protein
MLEWPDRCFNRSAVGRQPMPRQVRVLTLTAAIAAMAGAFVGRAGAGDDGVAFPTTAPATTSTSAIRPQRPGEDNTGPTDTRRLRNSGPITVTQDGSVVQDVDVRGSITIRASHVTVRNFRITTGGAYGIRVAASAGAVVIEDGEISGARSAGLYGGGFVARRLDIHDCGADGIKARSGAVIEGCWVRRLGTATGSHADGVQVSSGSHILIRYNHFDMPVGVEGTRSNACVFLKPDFGAINDVLVEGNWLNGGNYTVFVTTKDGRPCTNVRVVGNFLGRGYRYGIRMIKGPTNVWSGNHWMDREDQDAE